MNAHTHSQTHFLHTSIIIIIPISDAQLKLRSVLHHHDDRVVLLPPKLLQQCRYWWLAQAANTDILTRRQVQLLRGFLLFVCFWLLISTGRQLPRCMYLLDLESRLCVKLDLPATCPSRQG